MTRLLAALADGFQFLTRLPMPGRAKPLQPLTMAVFPLVGLFLGGMLWSVAAVLNGVLSQPLLNILLLALLALLSGAIHWDGLMDTADALGAPSERRLAVLKEVHAGSFAVLALVFVVATQWAALSALDGWRHAVALLLFPLWGRWIMPAVAWGMADLRAGSGLAGVFLQHLNGAHLFWASAVSAACSILLLGWIDGSILCAVMGLCAGALRWFFRSRFGGISGDLIGASCCMAEALALVLMSALVSH